MSHRMERRDVVLLLLLAGGAGYGLWAKWDVIAPKLGLDDLKPGRVHAIELAKQANSFEAARPNWMVLEDWKSNGDIALSPHAWTGHKVDDDHYQVVCTFKRDGEDRYLLFAVNIATTAVEVVGEESSQRPATPR
jgi:hypothetical protein